jgi:hypothetical protein
MSMLWIAVLVVSATPTQADTSASSPPASTAATAESQAQPPRTGKELESAVRDALQQWARPGDKQLDAAGRELLGLFCEIQRDKSLAKATRDELRQKLRSRLLQISQQITKQRAQQSYQAKHASKSAPGPKSVDVAPDNKTLGQVAPAAQGGGGGLGGGQSSNAYDNLPDAGEDLVQLIQTVVAPKSWDVNGGPGTIYYWRYQRSIVARTTAEVHDQISDVLEQLNRASH